MSDRSARLALPYLQPAQAQKHVTHNAALQRLDLLVQLVVAQFGASLPPEAPAEGMAWALGPAPEGDWAGQAGRLAWREGGGWSFIAPQEGWRAWGLAEGELRVWRAGGWALPAAAAPPALDGLQGLGIGTAHDATNRLAVAAAATLFSHAGAGHQLKLNKAAPAETASLLFQTNWSGRAEIGLIGDAALALKVSADGSTWTEALRADPATGRLQLSQGGQLASGSAAAPALGFLGDGDTGLFHPGENQIGFAAGGVPRAVLSAAGLQLDVALTGTAVTQGATDATAGRLLRVGDFGLGADTPPTCADLNDSTLRNGIYRTVGGVLNWAGLPQEWGVLQVIRTPSRITQIWFNDNTAATSGTVFRRMWASSTATWTPWYRLLDSRSAVGAITRHTDGQPTGPILERGSNANGDYTRLADGTQICTARLAGAAANVAVGAVFRSGDIGWTYPAAFAAEPRVAASCAGASNLWANAQASAGGNATTAVARLFSYQPEATAWDIACLAIGRWY